MEGQQVLKAVAKFRAQSSSEATISVSEWVGSRGNGNREDALAGLKAGSRVFVIFGFKNVPGWGLVKESADGKVLGVFSTRSRNRPNPFGFGMARISKVEKHVLHLNKWPRHLPSSAKIFDIQPFAKKSDSIKGIDDSQSSASNRSRTSEKKKPEKAAVQVTSKKKKRGAISLRGIKAMLKKKDSAPSKGSKSKVDDDDSIVARKFADLPPEYQNILKTAEISVEEANANWLVVLNILHFKTKLSFHNTFDEEMDSSASDSQGPTSNRAKMITSAKLVNPTDPKKTYKLAGLAGKGGFGRVYKAYKKPNPDNFIAIKRMPHSGNREKYRNLEEVYFLRECKHRGIVEFIDCYKVKDELWVITEFMQGGTLAEAVRGYEFKIDQIAYVAKEVCVALEYLHNRNIVHRDMKSANVMMTVTGDIKLIDFGLALDLSDGKKRSHMAGSPFWMPPEMIRREPYGLPCDIWSFAICLLELVNGAPPNKQNSLRALFVAGTTGITEPFEEPDKWPNNFKEFVKGMLVVDQNKRANIKSLVKHSFLKEPATKSAMEKVLKYIFMQNAINMAAFG